MNLEDSMQIARSIHTELHGQRAMLENARVVKKRIDDVMANTEVR